MKRNTILEVFFFQKPQQSPHTTQVFKYTYSLWQEIFYLFIMQKLRRKEHVSLFDDKFG